jgi:hypothetical protein
MALLLPRLEVAPGTKIVLLLRVVPLGVVTSAVPVLPAPVELTNELELLELLEPG